MIAFVIYLAIYCLGVVVLYLLLQKLLAIVPIDRPIKQAIEVIFLLICVLLLLGFLFGEVQFPRLRAF